MTPFGTTLYRAFADVLPRREPELWRLAYPRIYRDADRYGSPKTLAIAVVASVGAARDCYRDDLNVAPTNAAIYAACCGLAEHDTPALFVAPDLLRAALATEPPADLRWSEIDLPFDAAALMLPRGFVRHRTAGAIDFVGYARTQKLRPLRYPAGGCPPLRLADDSFVVWTALHESPKGESICRQYNGRLSPHVGTEPSLFDEFTGADEMGVSGDDEAVLTVCSDIVFRVMLAIEARPALLARGRRDGTHKKSRAEIWTPNVIGGSYRVARERSTDEPGASRRMHWRRGHYRNQRIGAQRAGVKRLWIEPVLVGGYE